MKFSFMIRSPSAHIECSLLALILYIFLSLNPSAGWGLLLSVSQCMHHTLEKKILAWFLHGPKGTIAFSFPFPFLTAKNITGQAGELKGHILGSFECSQGGKAVINNTLEDYVLGERGCPCLRGPVGRKGRRWEVFHLWRIWLLGKNSYCECLLKKPGSEL